MSAVTEDAPDLTPYGVAQTLVSALGVDAVWHLEAGPDRAEVRYGGHTVELKVSRTPAEAGPVAAVRPLWMR